jgi:predicted Zn-dependent protease
MMEVLKASSGRGGGPEFLSSHPDPGNRIEYLTKAIEGKYAQAAKTGTLGERSFQQQVLSRMPAPVAAAPRLMIDSSAPRSWCALCREQP